MGAWLCPLCGHGKFIWQRQTRYCARCDYQERATDQAGIKARVDNRSAGGTE